MTENWGDKLDKKPLNPDRELKRKINDYWKRNIKKKVADEKPPNPKRVLGGKPTSYDWDLKMTKESSQVWDLKVKR